MDTQATRDAMEAIRQEGFCVIVTQRDDGTWRARAYCTTDHRRDMEEIAETEIAAIKAILAQLPRLGVKGEAGGRQ